MGYVETNLVPNEEIIKFGKVHWGIYVPGAIWVVLGLLFLGASRGLGVVLLLIGVLLLLRAFIYSMNTELAVTNKRVIAKFGFLHTQTVELFHAKVEGLNVSQGLLGRLLGYGTVVVNGTGAGHTPIRGISQPLEFRKSALGAIEAAHSKS